MTLRVRWLGSVRYQDAHALQRGVCAQSADDHLLLLEHPHVFTLGARGGLDHLLVEPASVGAELVRSDRGGDITYHGPGQLVGYPLLHLPDKIGGHGAGAVEVAEQSGAAPSTNRMPEAPRGTRGNAAGMADTVAYVCSVEQLVIDVLADVGLSGADRLPGYPGVWIGVGTDHPRKIAAIGVRLTRGRTMHGFALNVAPDLSYFGHIIPCGIAATEGTVTSLAAELSAHKLPVPTLADVQFLLTAEFTSRWPEFNNAKPIA